MPQKQDLEPLLTVRQNQLNLVFNYAESLDTKNLAVLGANVAALLFALQTVPHVSFALRLGIFGAYITSMLINVVGIVPLNYHGASVDIDEYPEYLALPPDKLILQLLSDTQHSIVHNRNLNDIKLKLWITSLAFAAAGTGLLIWVILKT